MSTINTTNTRKAVIERKTKETDIKLELNIDGSGKFEGESGVSFFDHMLNSFCVHSRMDIKLACKGDLSVDCHHTVEDVGIVLGSALYKALGDKIGIERFGSSYVPMDEALGFAALDVSGRPFIKTEAGFKNEKIGDMDSQMIAEFFRAIAFNAMMTLHTKVDGVNDHHKAEALFKAFGRALCDAVKITSEDLLSAKGVL